MKLTDLFKDLPVKIFGEESQTISGISSNSKKVEKGHLFIAKSGRTYHGSDFIKEALKRGASAILTEKVEASIDKSVQIVSKDLVSIEGLLASRFYQKPSEKLKMIGITGTNGKTTTSFFIRQLMDEKKCGLIGTIEYVLGHEVIDATLTTPDVTSNHKMLSQMLDNQLEVAVMEATSIALTQNRLDEIDFDIALFTNFTQDHLDYHGSMDNYLMAKSLLFQKLKKDKLALINADEKEGNKLIEKCSAKIKTYGIKNKADYWAQNVELLPSKSTFDLEIKNNRYHFDVPLPGLYNVYNVLGAISVALESNIEIETVLQRAKKLKAPKGRLEPIENKLGAHIFVDFAHTEDALKNALLALRQIGEGRLITLFGCGGDRDPKKRPLMGKTVSELSDMTIITSDNPRSEDPQKICEEILGGCIANKEIYVESDRRKAMVYALRKIREKDILLVAGRGHEKKQQLKDTYIHFEDQKVLQEILEEMPY